MENGLNKISKSNHKAVAPIIATLLMVAIAVVGGILIFVFTQGFFADEQVVGPTVDNIRIFGYDARDGTGIDTHTDTALSNTCGAAGNTLTTGDCLGIYISNLGDKPVAIQSVRVFGETSTLGTTVASTQCGNTNGQFLILNAAGTEISIVEPNTDATICVKYDGSAGNVKAGRTIPVQVETSNGQSSQINVLNGVLRGQQ